MTRLAVALAIALLAPVMAISLVRDAKRRRGPEEPVAPPAATPEPSARRAPAPRAAVPTGLDGGARNGPTALEHPLSDALCPPDMLFVEASARLSFCIDRHEYPNVPGALPAMLLTFEMAEAACSHEGKRLCTDEEWTLACEGGARAPVALEPTAGADDCNVGPAAARVPVEKLWDARRLPALVERFDARARSGARPRCTSPFGVADLTGNVAEWVRTSAADPFPAALKGGDFTSARAPCRAVRRIRAPHYAAFAVGARCCADPVVDPPRRR
jgi:hypothetical protein